MIEDLDSEQKSIYLASVTTIINYKKSWRLLANLGQATKNLEHINQTNSQLKSSNGFEFLSEEKKQSFLKIIIDFIGNSYEYIKENISRYNLVIHQQDEHYDLIGRSPVDSSNRIWTLLQACLIIWSWASKSSEFCIKFHQLNGINVIFKFLNDNSFIFHLIERLKQQKFQWNRTVKSLFKVKVKSHASIYSHLSLILKALVGTIQNLTNYEHMYKNIWCDIGAFESLQKLTKLLSDEADSVQLMDIDFLAYFALIRLSRYKQDLELMNDRYLGKVYELVKIAGHKLALNEMVERRSYKLNDHINMAKIIVISSKENTKWQLTELIRALITLTDLNEDLKPDVFEQTCFSLKQILFNGNEIEKEYALKLIWKFCSCQELLEEIRRDVDVSSFVMGLAANKLQPVGNDVYKYCQLIMYCLRVDPVASNCSEVTRTYSKINFKF